MAKLMLITSWIALYSYIAEFFMAWYSGDQFDIYQAAREPAVRLVRMDVLD